MWALVLAVAAHAQSYSFVTARTVAFEDIPAAYPSSDLDMNDVVVRYVAQCDLDPGGHVVAQQVHFAAVAAGASKVNELWLTPPADVASATLAQDGGDPVALTPGPDLQLFADFTSAFVGAAPGFVNTEGGVTVPSSAWSLTLEFATPFLPTPNVCPPLAFSVRRPDGTHIDLSTTVDDQPITGTFDGWWAPPLERTAVFDAYPWFLDWAGGTCAETVDPPACLAWDQHPDALEVDGRTPAELDTDAPLPPIPNCLDGVQNGTERGTDCNDARGLCPACGGGEPCDGPADCASGSCVAGVCDANYWGRGVDGPLVTSGNVSLPATLDGDVVVRRYSALTIQAGHTLTLSQRAKGLVIYVEGDAVINGTLTMTARGAAVDPVAAGVPASGLRFPRFTASGTATLAASDVAGTGAALSAAEALQVGVAGDGTVFTLARGGAPGATSTTVPSDGAAGQSGGGGAGDAQCAAYGYGTTGTVFSGGSGGASSCVSAADAAQPNGGRGGNAGTGFAGLCSWNSGGGGAGNPPGSGAGCGGAGGTGTGGMLVLMVRGNLTIGSSGLISADGVKGGDSATGMRDRQQGGGGSGGGNVLVLYGGTLSNAGTIRANGGAGGFGSVVNVYGGGPGGRGGHGSVQVVQVLQ